MAFTFYIHGELGNQMFQWSTGIALSKVTGRRVNFKVAPGYSLRLGEYVTKLKYLPDTDSGNSFLGQRKMFHSIYSVAKRLPNQYFFNEKNLCYQDLTKVSAKLFHGYFQSWRYFHQFRNEILNEFSIAKPSQQFTDLVSTLPYDFTGIHIRRGGSGAAILAEEFHGLLDSDYYQRAIQLNKSLGGSTNYIVFTDNHERAKKTLQKIGLPDARVISPVDTYSQVENLQIMSLAKSFIGANSSYSWWAAYLAKELKTPPIFPRQWYMDPSISTNDMLLPEWISVGFSKFLNEESVREVK